VSKLVEELLVGLAKRQRCKLIARGGFLDGDGVVVVCLHRSKLLREGVVGDIYGADCLDCVDLVLEVWISLHHRAIVAAVLRCDVHVRLRDT
jgi:hypothetical protein